MSESLTFQKEYCSVCDAEHMMLDGGDIFDCWNYMLKKKKELRKQKVLKVSDLIKAKEDSSAEEELFYFINKNSSVRELIAYLTKHNIQACAVVNKVKKETDGRTYSTSVLGEIGWNEIARNISSILDDQVGKYMKKAFHGMQDSRNLIEVKSALKKKRLFCIVDKQKRYYATINSDDLLNYYETIINPFQLLREIEISIRVILNHYNIELNEEASFGDFVKRFLKAEVYDNIPYDFPKTDLAELLNNSIEQRNKFFHHRTKKADTNILKNCWKELNVIYNNLEKSKK